MTTFDVDVHATNRVGGAKDRDLLRRMLLFARAHGLALTASVGLLVVGLGMHLLGPWIIRHVIDGPLATAVATRGTPDFDLGALGREILRWALLYLGVAGALSISLVAREWVMNRMGQRIVLALRGTLFHHVLRLPIAWFDRHSVGWTVTRTTSDVDSLSELFTTGVATVASDLLTIVVVLVLLVWISPALSSAALLVLPLMVWVSFRFRLKARLAYRATRTSLSRMNGFLQERLVGLDVVRLFRRERASCARFAELNDHYYRDNLVTVRHFSLFFPVVDVHVWAVRLLTLVWGGWLVHEGRLSFGEWWQYWFYLDLVFEPVRELAERYNVLQAAMAAGERVFGILDAPTEAGPVGLAAAIAAAQDGRAAAERSAAGPRERQAAPAADGGARAAPPPAVEFEHVSFAYGAGPPVLADVSFAIPRGQRVALVGHTGAGKTTVTSLLCRFHEASSGTVRVAGLDVARIPHQDLRRRIAIVQQDVFLFSDTIAANIRLGNPSLSDEEVVAVARAVNADRFVERLPLGYDTLLRERGSNLSSGQRQLLAFARALAADPEILILDEATSSVDSETEGWIEEATATLLAGRTSLVIAHRLSTVVGADRILVLHKGELRESGTHEELLAHRGLYHRLYRLHLDAGVV